MGNRTAWGCLETYDTHAADLDLKYLSHKLHNRENVDIVGPSNDILEVAPSRCSN